MANLIEGLLTEMNRVRELIKEYESLPDGVGLMGASLMKQEIKQAEEAIASGDITKELFAYKSLQECIGYLTT